MIGVGHGDDHHRAAAAALEALEGPLGAVGKAQFEAFDGEQATARDLLAAEDLGFVERYWRHGGRIRTMKLIVFVSFTTAPEPLANA
ncbi:hypothetical protein GCM10023342_16320 [Modicisalibacter zincidurans]|uniref:Uncharacterized protein n=1 Tax=Modicisalibacter zincidurans TaxID=1178777 RepID=A0ABP9RCT5_9GAMM